MGYPARLLGDGEEVLLEVRPHWRFLAGSIVPVVVLLVISAAAATISAPAALDWVLVVLLGSSVVRLLWRYGRWASTSLVVTTQRLVARKGLLARNSWAVMLDRVSEVSYRQSLPGRIMRYGDLLVDSPGREGVDRFSAVPRPAEVQATIQRQASALHQARMWPQPPAPTGSTLSFAAPLSQIPEQIEKLDELRRRGIITHAEFEAKKAQLLDRL